MPHVWPTWRWSGSSRVSSPGPLPSHIVDIRISQERPDHAHELHSRAGGPTVSLDLQILRRSLAAVGNLFVLDPLALVDSRKARLDALLRRSSVATGILLNEHTDHDGARVLEHACRMRLEGIVAKRIALP
jgi:hypothetical protein